MTYLEVTGIIEDLAEALNCDYAYYKFDKENATNPPFIIYRYDDSDDFSADNTNYVGVRELIIEFYSDNKDFAKEKIIEDLLKEHEIPFERSEVWIDSEKMYEISYNMEVLING